MMLFQKVLYTSIIVLIISQLSSCGFDSGATRDIASNSIGEALLKNSIISGDAQKTAYRICFAFRSKRVEYLSNQLGNSFNFSLSETDCEGSKSDKDISATLRQLLSSEPMIYDSAQSRYRQFHDTVETDRDGLLQNICRSILRNEDVSNTLQNSEQTTQVDFSTSGTDRFVILKGLYLDDSETNETKSIVTERITFTVNTVNSNNPLKYGSVSSIEKESLCDSPSLSDDLNSSQIETFKQVKQY